MSPFPWSSIVVVSSIFVQFLWEEMNVFVRPAEAGGAGDGKKHRGRDSDLKNISENKLRELKCKKKRQKKEPVSSLTKSNSNVAFVNNRDNICSPQQTLSKYITLSLCLEPPRQTQLFKYFGMYFCEEGPSPVPTRCTGFPWFQRVMARASGDVNTADLGLTTQPVLGSAERPGSNW